MEIGDPGAVTKQGPPLSIAAGVAAANGRVSWAVQPARQSIQTAATALDTLTFAPPPRAGKRTFSRETNVEILVFTTYTLEPGVS
jgi:hypothetical protein